MTRIHRPERLAIFRRARTIDEDAPPHLCGNSEELVAILPCDPVLLDQPQIRFVDQGRRLERVAGTLAPQVHRRATLKVAVDERQEPIARIEVPPAPCLQQRAQIRVCVTHDVLSGCKSAI